MTSEKYSLLPVDILSIVDLKRDERARVVALQSFLDEGGAIAESELEQIENNAVINEEIARLDKDCSHINRPVFVSGDVRVGYYDEFEEKDAEEVRHLVDTPLISKGFSVQRATSNASDDGLVVGHLFEIPGAARTNGANGLAEQTTVYYGFAAYDSVDIGTEHTSEERRVYLESMIPEIMNEVDELLFDAPTALAAVMRLRKMTIDRDNVPADIIRELISYVSEFVELEKIPLSVFELTGTRSIDISNDFSITAPYDKDHYTGGSAAVIGKVSYLYLSPYTAYVDGEMYGEKGCRWALGINTEAASGSHSHLVGQTLDVMIADIDDASPVMLPDLHD